VPPSVRPAGATTVLGPTGSLRGSAPTPPAPEGKRSSGQTQPFGTSQRIVTDPGKPGPVTRELILAKYAQVERNADHFTMLEIDRNATSEQAKTAYFTLVKIYHPDKLGPARLEQLKMQADRIFNQLRIAFGELSDDAKRTKYLRLLAEGGEEAVRKRDDEATAKATKILIAEEHFKRGEMAMRRQSYAAALEEFQSAIESNDGEADYHAALGWAKWCNATDKPAIQAEVRADFSKALKLNIRCLDALYYRGRMYNDVGDIEKASKAFNHVLQLDSDHVEAARELRVLEMRKKGGGGKGLFDRFRKK
jgi:tetratricopeptide (TPR) repeat protein